ncbi:MAG TPA: ferritin-like domain-containing protein [Polyangiaceae bacterium]|nr:ferritin-like domain-containing protein [Polyangiaceae bacterium]
MSLRRRIASALENVEHDLPAVVRPAFRAGRHLVSVGDREPEPEREATTPAASAWPDSPKPVNYTELAKLFTVPAKEGPTGTEALGVSYSMAYTWEYHTQRIDLRALYEKSKDLMWNARTLPWSTNVDPEGETVPDVMNPLFGSDVWRKLEKDGKIPDLRRNVGSWMLSNFLHGEQGALLATAQIVNCAPGSDAKLYASAQVMDEARHVEAYDRYLRDKFELVYPISPHLKSLLDSILTDSRWDMKYLGMQIMVEGLALAAFGVIHQTSNEPLIKQITEQIMQDEARHVAFGVLSLKDVYKDMPEKDMHDREDFIIEASHQLRDRFLGQEVWARMGLPQKECEEAAEHSEMMKMFRTLLFAKIVPNVKRLGLSTPRVRAAWEEMGVLHFEKLAEGDA